MYPNNSNDDEINQTDSNVKNTDNISTAKVEKDNVSYNNIEDDDVSDKQKNKKNILWWVLLFIIVFLGVAFYGLKKAGLAQESLSTVQEVYSNIPLSYYIIAAVWIIANIVQANLIKKKKIYTGGQRKVDAAIKAGHVVYAELERISFEGNHSDNNYSTYRGIYTYMVNGKEYRKGLKKESKKFKNPLKLYYVSNPANAKTLGEMKFWSEKVLPIIMPLLLAVLTAFILGAV